MTFTPTQFPAVVRAPAQALVDDVNSAVHAELFPELTLKDRCDGCGAAAKAQVSVDVTKPNLLFCGHHWRKSRAVLTHPSSGYRFAAPDAEHDLPFTDRNNATRPKQSNAARDAGSANA